MIGLLSGSIIPDFLMSETQQHIFFFLREIKAHRAIHFPWGLMNIYIYI